MNFGVLARLSLVSAGLGVTLAAEPPLAADGYLHFYNLEYDEAISDFTRLIAQQPELAEGYNHLAEAVLYRNMFRAGALETQLVTGNNPFLRRPKVNASAEDQQQFQDAISRAMGLAQEQLERDPGDTRALYTLGVSYGLRANYNFLVRKAWRDALRDATSARRMHNRVTSLDPSFIDARLVEGIHEYVVGSLPFTWKMLGFLVGFRGNKDEGIRTLETVAAQGDSNRLEAEFLLCAVYRREKRPEQAVPLVEKLMRQFPRNFLLPMELAQMYSDLGDGDQALAVLRRLARLKRRGSFAHLPMEKIDYAAGNIEFWYNRLDPALRHMKRAAAAAEDLDLNTGVLAWMRMGQIYDLKGERPQAIEAYRHAIVFAPDSDAARESRGYLSSPYRRKQKG